MPDPADCGNLESNKIQNVKIIKIKIRSAQNVDKVWISTTKVSRLHLGPFQVTFPMDRTQKMGEKTHAGEKLLVFLGGPIGFYFPGWGAAAVSGGSNS